MFQNIKFDTSCTMSVIYQSRIEWKLSICYSFSTSQILCPDDKKADTKERSSKMRMAYKEEVK